MAAMSLLNETSDQAASQFGASINFDSEPGPVEHSIEQFAPAFDSIDFDEIKRPWPAINAARFRTVSEDSELSAFVRENRLVPRLIIAGLVVLVGALMFVIPGQLSASEASSEALTSNAATPVDLGGDIMQLVITQTIPPAAPPAAEAIRETTTTTAPKTTTTPEVVTTLTAATTAPPATEARPKAPLATEARPKEPSTTQKAAATTAPAQPSTTRPSEPEFVDAGHGVMVPPIALKIRWCESRDRYKAANPSSSARGAYQFITSTWNAYADPLGIKANQAHLATNADQDRVMAAALAASGTRPWNASKSCWN